MQVSLVKKEGSILPNMRQAFAELAVNTGATHLFFVDTDQAFPADTLWRLLAWDRSVVACNIVTKAMPATTTARAKTDVTDKGKVVFSPPGQEGLTPVWRVGTGIMLIKTRVFKDMDMPWFPMTWRDDGTIHKYQGEDWGFCEKLEKAGIPIFVDMGLSREVTHVGRYAYGHDLIDTQLGLDKMQDKELKNGS